MRHYVDLDRRFRVVEPSKIEGRRDEDTFRKFWRREGLSWRQLLDRRVVVILGEAGSGKTTELTEAAHRLRAEGCSAFFCRIEELAKDGAPSAFASIDDRTRFADWLSGDGEGAFFADSVDEARLIGERLDTALKKLGQAIGPTQGTRVRVIVSSRISDWRPEADLAAVKRTGEELGISVPTPPEPNLAGDITQDEVPERGRPCEPQSPTIVELEPLDETRFRTLATALGVIDADALVRAIEATDAWGFSGRPLDVEWIVGLWNDKGQLGSWRELVAHNVATKLEETTDDRRHRDPLSKQKAEQGARRLAAACTLCGQPSILQPGVHAALTGGREALDPTNVLSDWPPGEIKALLGRALFDPAAYSRVRFHHRAVQEWLTAEWFRELLALGCPHTELMRLLFVDCEGEDAALPAMEPVVGWLALHDDEMRERALRFAPWVLLEQGDPSGLPPETRKAVVRRVVRERARSYTQFGRVSVAELRRFVHPDLASMVSEYLAAAETSDAARGLLIDMVRVGRFSACADNVCAIASCTNQPDHLRQLAIFTLGHLGAKQEIKRLLEAFEKDCHTLPPGCCFELIKAACPRLMAVEQAIDSLAELEDTAEQAEEDEGLPGEKKDFLERLLRDLDVAHVKTAVAIIGARLKHMVQQTLPPAREWAWFAQPLCAGLARLVDARSSLSPEDLVEAIEVLERARERHPALRGDFDELTASIAGHRELVRLLFRRAVARAREIAMHGQDRPSSVDRLYQVEQCYHCWSLSAHDLEWLLEDLRIGSSRDDKALAFDAAMHCWHLGGRDSAHLPALEAAAEEQDLRSLFNEYLVPSKTQAAREAEQARRKEARNQGAADKLEQTRQWLASRLSAISTGEDLHGLHILWQHMAGPNSRCTKLDTSNLAAVFGLEIARAAREGLKRSWRRWQPPLPSEHKASGSIPVQVRLGLSGIAIELADGLDVASLAREEAAIATRYAPWEMNAFPGWLAALAQVHPGVVTDVLTAEIGQEMGNPATKADHPQTLSHLRNSGSELARLVVPHVLNCLETTIDVAPLALPHALWIAVEHSGEHRDRLARIVADRAQKRAGREMLALWLGAWLVVRGLDAVDYLERHLSTLSAPERDRLMLDMSAAFAPLRGPLPLLPGLPSELPTAVIERLLPITYRHVPLEEDVVHYGSYTQTQRDDAEHFRSHLLTLLTERPQAVPALRRLADTSELVALRDFLLWRAYELTRAEAQSRRAAWRESQVPAFERRFAAEPRTSDELFELVLALLTDINADVERGDFSPRALFHSKGTTDRPVPEEEVQKWLASQLQLRRHNRYQVVREEEVDRRKKPDLRIHPLYCSGPGSGPVSIEIKVADSWNYEKLASALEEQLIGQYMRAANARHGILLVAWYGHQQRWKRKANDASLSFRELTADLQVRAQELEQAGSGRLAVVALDFSASATCASTPPGS